MICFRFFHALSLGFILSALSCAKNTTYTNQLHVISGDTAQEVQPGTPLNPDQSKLTFCSPLSFKQVHWSSTLTPLEQRSMAIALSISGSFEGGEGWQNITNNFDGMGLSAGLLNQTLGTESLQPLLATYEELYPNAFRNHFSRSHYESLLGMIDPWKKKQSWKPSDGFISLGDEKTSPLDQQPQNQILQKTSSVSTNASVEWAKKNLYQSSGAFVKSWQAELQNMLSSPVYISYQIETARKYHLKTISYLKRMKMSDITSYLLMFDVVVQNGGISDSIFSEWETKVKNEKIANTKQKLKALIDLRLKVVNPKWTDDVKSRKYALIEGMGKVHGRSYNFSKDYCFQNTDQIR